MNCTIIATPSQNWTTAQGKIVRPEPIAINVVNGVLNTTLEDNTTSIPSGTSYNVQYACGSNPQTKSWVVPTGGPVGIQTIETNTLVGTTSLIAFSQLQGLLTGNGLRLVTALVGAQPNGKCTEWDSNGNLVTAVDNAACGTGGGGGGSGLTLCVAGSGGAGVHYTCTPTFTLGDGATVAVRFDVPNTVTNPDLNITSTGIGVIKRRDGTAVVNSEWPVANQWVLLTYYSATTDYRLAETKLVTDGTGVITNYGVNPPTLGRDTTIIPGLANNNVYSGINAWTPSTNQSITAVGNAVLCNGNVVQVTPASGLTLTSAPTVAAAGNDGTPCSIQNLSASNTLTVQDESVLPGSNLLLGGSNVAIAPKQTLTIRYNNTLGKWVRDGIGGTGSGTTRAFQLYSAVATSPVTCNGSVQTLDSYTIAANTLQVNDTIDIDASFEKSGAAAAATFAIGFGSTATITPSCCFPTTGVSDTNYYEHLYYTVGGSSSETVSGLVIAHNGTTFGARNFPTDGSSAISGNITVYAIQNCTASDTGRMRSWSIRVTR